MKYKDNGEWKEITIKTMDTLPFGSIVDYAGASIPSGWEEIEDQTPKIYSGIEEPDEELGKIGDLYILLEDVSTQSEEEISTVEEA